MNADSGDKESGGKAAGGGEHGFARADAFEPGAEDRGGETQENDGDGEDPADGGEGSNRQGLETISSLPLWGSAGAEKFGERNIEYTEGIGLADGEMHGEGGGGDQPAVEAGPGDDALAVEDGEKGQGIPPEATGGGWRFANDCIAGKGGTRLGGDHFVTANLPLDSLMVLIMRQTVWSHAFDSMDSTPMREM